MKVTRSTTGSLVLNPNSTGTSSTYLTNQTNAYYGTDHTSSYATLSTTTSTTTRYGYFKFDTAQITNNANITAINSVTCSVRTEKTANTGTAYAVLLNNTTVNGAQTTISSQASTVTSIANTGTWTLNNLANLQLRMGIKRSARNTAVNLYVYGADLTINYTYNYKVEVPVITTSITNGTFTSHTGDTIEKEVGDSQTISFTPDEYYELSAFVVDGNIVTPTKNGNVYSYTFNNLQGDHTVAVICSELNKYNITTTINNGELVSPTSSFASIYSGYSYEIKFTGIEDNVFNSITVNGINVTPTLNGDIYTYTISAISENKTVVIDYTVLPKAYVNTSIINGDFVAPASGSMKCTKGNNIQLIFTGNDGEDFNTMLVDNTVVTPTLHKPTSAITYTISTNYATYQTYNITNAIDGDESTFFWANGGQEPGKYVMLTFSEPIILTSISTTSDKGSGQSGRYTDYANPGNELQVSSDGNNWTKVDNFPAAANATFDNLCYFNTKYVRIYFAASAAVSNWLVLNEFTPTFLDTYYTYDFNNLYDDKNVTIIFGDDVTTNTITTTINNGTLTNGTIPSKIVISGSDVTLNFTGEGDNIFKSMYVNGVAVEPTFGHYGTTGYNISTNYTQATGVNQIYGVIDGSNDTYFQSSDTQQAGKYVLITFNESVTITDVVVYCGQGSGYVQANNTLQVSGDGNNWTDVGTFVAQATNTFNGINRPGIKYLRIYANTTNANTLNLTEMTMTYYTVINEYEYVLNNVNSDTNVVINFGPYTGAYVKYPDGTWHKSEKIYQKKATGWEEITVEQFQSIVQIYKLIHKDNLVVLDD